MRSRACRCMMGLMRYRTRRYNYVGVFWWIRNYYAMCYCSNLFIVKYYMTFYERCVCAVLEL